MLTELSRKEAMERIITAGIYHADLTKMKSLKEEKKLKNVADAIRICIEYSQSHGVFT